MNKHVKARIERRQIEKKLEGTLFRVDEITGEVVSQDNAYTKEDLGTVVVKYDTYHINCEEAEANIMEAYSMQDYGRIMHMTRMLMDSTYILSDKAGMYYHTAETLQKTLKLGRSAFYDLMRQLRKHAIIAVVFIAETKRYIINPYLVRRGPIDKTMFALFKDHDLSKGLSALEINEVKSNKLV